MDNNTTKNYPPGCVWHRTTPWSPVCEVHGDKPCVPYPEMDDDDIRLLVLDQLHDGRPAAVNLRHHPRETLERIIDMLVELSPDADPFA